MTAAPKDLASSLRTLAIHPTPSKSSPAFATPQSSSTSKTKPQKVPIADSWEDDASDSGTETETESKFPNSLSGSTPLSPTESNSYPSVPPPTPISPTATSHFPAPTSSGSSKARNTQGLDDFANPFGYPGDGEEGSSSARGGSGKRQEKTDAVARRMIAGALGVRAPKKTEEQKEYERVAREKEVRRKREQKEEEQRSKEEEESKKREVWDD